MTIGNLSTATEPHYIRFPMASEATLENLARMVRVIESDRLLRRSFEALARKSADDRRDAIHALSQQMRADGKDEDLIVAFRLLADDRIFEAARVALQELA